MLQVPIDYVGQYLEKKYLSKPVVIDETGMVCPECGASAVSQEGCLMCSNAKCGWSRC